MQHLCDKNDTQCSFIAIFAHSKLVEEGVSTVIYYGVTALEATVIILLASVAIPYTFLDAVRKVFERSFATARIFSYERETRLEISILSITATVILSAVFACVILFCISNPLIYACVSICFAIGVVCGITILCLHRTNSKRLERIVSWEARDLYTIGYKYQLLENLRAFKLLFSIGVYGSIGIIASVAAIAASICCYHFHIANIRVLFGALFEAVNATTILVVIIAGQHSQWMWSHTLLLRLATRLGCFKREHNAYDESHEMQAMRSIDLHFDRLCGKWNEKYDIFSQSRSSLPRACHVRRLNASETLYLIGYYGDSHYIVPGWNSALYYSFTLPELVLLLYNFIFTSFALNIVRKSAVFHKNLIAIAMFLFVHGYMHVTMRSVLILYQNNVIALDDANVNNVAHVVAFIASLLRNYQTLAIMQLFPITIAVTLLLINKRRFNRILLKYDLSTKYQLTENLRAFRFIEIIIVWGIIGTTSSNLILLFGATDRANCQFVSLCGAAYEIQSTLSYTLGVSACFLTQTEWRLQLMERLKKVSRRLRHLIFTVILGFESASSVSTSTTSKAQTTRLPPSLKTARKPEDEARIYFNDLARAWDAKFVNR
ncbi:hypothetical protein PRIPAC_82617 [Pristionchus pacificus]|uniref:G protein-coupled receptor n=1 Tax=Pristionchus pacificus TaxID=54126 RepID=A0A2A6BVU6_PRIPA|nr:hypothetical protein PRIPAC_82617 [Pristionchus pacificus]|eukprot:PDM70024.1 G protein-coupled receptor [Pristionchus pacificus]